MVSVDLPEELFEGGVPAHDDSLAGGTQPTLGSANTVLTQDMAVTTLIT